MEGRRWMRNKEERRSRRKEGVGGQREKDGER